MFDWFTAAVSRTALTGTLQWSNPIHTPFINYSHCDIDTAVNTDEIVYMTESQYMQSTPPFTLNEIQLTVPPFTHSELPWGNSKVAVVAASYKENTDWLSELRWPVLVYYQGNKQATTFWSYGHCNEGSSYLAYISQYYDNLPEYTVFIHAHQRGWHSSDDMNNILNNLDWDMITTTGGYYPLNCDNLYTIHNDLPWIMLSRRWTQLFGGDVNNGALNEPIRFYCCAEFIVDSATIKQHSRQFYIDLYHWCRETYILPHHAGRLLEYTWHMIFGQPPVTTYGHDQSTYCRALRAQ